MCVVCGVCACVWCVRVVCVYVVCVCVWCVRVVCVCVRGVCVCVCVCGAFKWWIILPVFLIPPCYSVCDLFEVLFVVLLQSSLLAVN